MKKQRELAQSLAKLTMKDKDAKSGVDTSTELKVIQESGTLKPNFLDTFNTAAVEMDELLTSTKDNNYGYNLVGCSNYYKMYTNETSTNFPGDSVSVDLSNKKTLHDYTNDILPNPDSQRNQGSCSPSLPKLQPEESNFELVPIEPEQAKYLENLRNEFKDMPVMMFYNIVRLWHVQQELAETQD